MITRSTGISLAFLGAVLACSADSTPQSHPNAQEPTSPEARIEAQMVEAMGGRAAWETARVFDFVFAVNLGPDRPPLERRHVWDRWTGRYRLEMPSPAGEILALFNANSRTGDVWLDGEPVLDAARRDSLLDRAHGAYINDTYWLVMPFKWLDPGVTLAYQGTVTDSTGTEWEAVELTFDNVGRTPENRYVAYVDPTTHLMGWWQHFATRDQTESRTQTRWIDWQERGGVLMSLDRPRLDGSQAIYFPRVVITPTVDESVFTNPNE